MSMRFGMVAGEVSGDLLAGLLLEGLTARWPGLQPYGIGGPCMAQYGFQALWPYEKLAVRGYVEVLRHYREIVGIRRQLKERLLADRPPLFIGVDAPDFNLELEGALRQAGIRTVQFVCPSIWAWRPKRVETLRRNCDHVLCIFPFEPELLARHGVAATFVGHPLANVIPLEPDRAVARQALGLAPDGEVVAVLPGSRSSEVRSLAEVFFRAAARIQAGRPAIEFVAPVVPSQLAAVRAAAQAAGLVRGLRIVEGRSHEALAACDVTLIASGTATLEAALFKRPMVVSYRVNRITYEIMKRQALQPWIGLPNILLQEAAVPELLQHDATPDKLAAAVLDWLDAPARMAAIREKFMALHHTLRRDTAQLATDAIEKVLHQRQGA